RCANITRAVEAGQSKHFRIHRSRLQAAARAVADVTRRRFRTLEIPYHSRWRHFASGGVDRKGEFDRRMKHATESERLRAQIDLVVISVLLDAGAGAAWSYREPGTVDDYQRSEGLGVATFCAFLAGAFSASPGEPMRVDAAALTDIDAGSLGRWFQVSRDNPLVGLEGRAALLRRLGDVLETRPDRFGLTSRPAALFDRMLGTRTIAAPAILRALLEGFGPIWRANPTFAGDDAEARIHGDVWRHRHAGGSGATVGYVPFHKLSQWLAYSLFEPFEWAGYTILDRDALTALPEYRNGGLLIDSEVLELINPADRETVWEVGSEIIVEWRALTVTLLDDLAEFVRAELGKPELPLACVLEGGTWATGRALANKLRNGEPPLNVQSDGTVF
ncbi:MAG TPA: DUF1688 family protein, partial [Casimicrobiaceae bacterium]|nr:DUF1688 family protein [Casimicrobiaceae bacterium]